MAYVGTVRTASGAIAVQVVSKSSRGSSDIEHLGSAHTDAEVELLKAVGRSGSPLARTRCRSMSPPRRSRHVGDHLVADGQAGGCDRRGVTPTRSRQSVRQGCGVRAVGDGADQRTDQQNKTRLGCWPKPGCPTRRHQRSTHRHPRASALIWPKVGSRPFPTLMRQPCELRI